MYELRLACRSAADILRGLRGLRGLRVLPILLIPLLAGCATANGRPASSAPAHPTGDEDFLDRAARDGLAEVQLARFAADKATDPRVKDLARDMLADFEQSNAHLRQLAAGKGLSLPQDLDRAEKWDYRSLARLSGADLHRYYVNMVAEYHVKEVRQFRREVGRTTDPEIHRFAAATLAVLKAGREKAQGLVPLFGNGRTFGGDTPQ
jgi:putative membrane protein